jgi:hypothetical protein
VTESEGKLLDLIERLIVSGWIESGPRDNRVRETSYNPTAANEFGEWCAFCDAPTEWGRPNSDRTVHLSDCAWVEAMKLLGHDLPKGHTETERGL